MNINRRLGNFRYHDAILTVVLAIQACAGMAAGVMEYEYPFSEARATARFIRQEGLDHMIMVGDVDYAASTIPGYLGNTIYYPWSHRFGSFIVWDNNRTNTVPINYLLEEAKQLGGTNSQNVLLILNHPMPQEIQSQYNVTEIHRFVDAVEKQENFYLYRFR